MKQEESEGKGEKKRGRRTKESTIDRGRRGGEGRRERSL